MRRTTIARCLLVPVIALGVAACGADTKSEVTSQAVDQKTSPTATKTATATATATATKTKTASAANETTASNNGVRAKKIEPAKLLGVIMAYENQALNMTEAKGTREVTPEFEELLTVVDNAATKYSASVERWSAAKSVPVTEVKPEGLLSEDQVKNASTPSGAEFENAWKTLMVKQRKSQLAYLETVTTDDAEAKKVIAQVKKDLNKQLELMQ